MQIQEAVGVNNDGSQLISVGGTAVSPTNPLPVYSATPSADVTQQNFQAVIASSGTAVQFTATSYVLLNGATVTAHPLNTALTSTVGGVVGPSTVTDSVAGTGVGSFLPPSGQVSYGPGVNINTIYVNGITGDKFSISGS